MSNSALTTTRFVPRRWLMTAASWLWFWLRRPWLAIAAGCIGLVLALAAWQLPQLPGQLVDEHAAAATWLLNSSTAYGIWGNAFLALGLFHVLGSPLLYLLLALLIPTLAAQLADQLGALRQQRSVFSYELATPVERPAMAIPLSPARPLFRWRGLVMADPTILPDALASKIKDEFALVRQADALITSHPHHSPEGLQDEAEPVTETRLMGMRHLRTNYIRPLLMVGLLVCVAGAWIALAFGWQVTAPPLAPGATFRSANRNLVLHYTTPPTGTRTIALEASLQGTKLTIVTEQATQQRLGPATLQLRPTHPAIWIATTDGSERLALPGESKLRAQIGLVFATPGSEESILIPDQSSGLRIVQRAGGDGFVLELYRSDADQPVYRAELTTGGHLSLPFAPDPLKLDISALPGLQVDVRHLPGLWLVPIGMLLALIGAIAYLRPNAYVLVQVAPWTADHLVVVLQSDHPHIVADLRATIIGLSLPAPEEDTIDEASPPTLSQPTL